MPRRRTRPTLFVATKQSPSTDNSLQKYLQLSNQKDNLHHRLSFSTSSATTSPGSAPSPTDPFSLSPITSISPPLQPSNYNTSVSTYLSTSEPVETMPQPGPVTSTSHTRPDEEHLADVNHQIKATLTELLNHESVRHDDGFRHWVQERLMEAELETRKQRRRSRRRSSIDREAVSNSIAENIRGPELFRFSTTV